VARRGTLIFASSCTAWIRSGDSSPGATQPKTLWEKRDVGPGRNMSGPVGRALLMLVVGVSRGHEVIGRSLSVVVVVGGV
jgi:hypothetical protein